MGVQVIVASPHTHVTCNWGQEHQEREGRQKKKRWILLYICAPMLETKQRKELVHESGDEARKGRLIARGRNISK
jgi:hypothetical protein